MNEKIVKGAIAGVSAGVIGLNQAAAQEEIAAAGNGGTADASANGGAVAVDGGAIANATDLSVTVNGGTAISDASGGDYNVAFLDEFRFVGPDGGDNGDDGFLS